MDLAKEWHKINWKKVGADAQKGLTTTLKAISLGAKTSTLFHREDPELVSAILRRAEELEELERRHKFDWSKVKSAAWTAANDAIDIASTTVDVIKAVKGKRSDPELELMEALLRRAVELDELERRGVDVAELDDLERRDIDFDDLERRNINWRKVRHVAGTVAKDALMVAPLILREAELDELD